LADGSLEASHLTRATTRGPTDGSGVISKLTVRTDSQVSYTSNGASCIDSRRDFVPFQYVCPVLVRFRNPNFRTGVSPIQWRNSRRFVACGARFRSPIYSSSDTVRDRRGSSIGRRVEGAGRRAVAAAVASAGPRSRGVDAVGVPFRALRWTTYRRPTIGSRRASTGARSSRRTGTSSVGGGGR
jgi:hypothetical protein